MDSKDSEKMRHELESFLNSTLKQSERAWPVKHLDLLKKKTKKQEDTGVFTQPDFSQTS